MCVSVLMMMMLRNAGTNIDKLLILLRFVYFIDKYQIMTN